MRILVDVDGVCADFTGHLLTQLPTILSPSDIDRWDLFELMPREVKIQAYQILESPMFWESQPAFYSATIAIPKLRAVGHEIVWVTSPWKGCVGWADARREWLKKNMGADDEHIVVTAAKHLVVGDVMIDDKLENVASWAAERWSEGRLPLPFLFDAPYNRNLEWDGPRGDWADALDMIAECP